MHPIEQLLVSIDKGWTPLPEAGRIRLQVIGQAALFLQTGYDRGTRDGDILETRQVAGPVRVQLEALAGPGTVLAERHGVYIDVVGAAVPLLPQAPLWHRYPMELAHFDVVTLDIADVLVSKLYRNTSTDRDDIRAMVDGAQVSHELLCQRLQAVIDHHQFAGRSDRLPVMVERFHAVERDLFLVDETDFTLHPSVYR